MTTTPPGWYSDASSDTPQLRWWDGERWTEHTSPGSSSPGPAPEPSTPDGVELATWARRLGAWAIDYAIVMTVVQVALIPVYAKFFDAFSRMIEAADPVTGEVPPSVAEDVFRDIFGLYGWVIGATLLGTLVFHALFLRWKAATPGKLVLGLRVRRWKDDRPLGWGLSIGRAASQYLLLSVIWFIDGLWPLWDDRRQTLHDKIVRTVVVHVEKHGV